MNSRTSEGDMDLSVTVEEASNSIVAEVIIANDDCCELPDVTDEEIVLHLTVEDDAPYSSSCQNSLVAEDTASSCDSAGRQGNMPLSPLRKRSSIRTLSRHAASAIAGAQARVFRQYILDGDAEANVSKLDNSCGFAGKTSVWGELAMRMYGEYDRRLQQRMYVAWRRRRPGSVRDRVLAALSVEGVISHYSPWVAAKSNHPLNGESAARNQLQALDNNCHSLLNSDNVMHPCQLRHETCVKDVAACSNKTSRQNGTTGNSHDKLQDNITKHESSVVTSNTLKGRNEPLLSHHSRVCNAISDVTRRQRCRHTQPIYPPNNVDSNVSRLPSPLQQMSDETLELDDVDIQKAMDILKTHCPDVAGLEHVGLGTCVHGQSVPRFAAAGSRRFVQIVNVGDHWVCASNWFGDTACDVYVYDSLFSRVTQSLVVQISSILRLDTSSSSITFHIREFKQQKPGTRWCGYYAVAAAFAVCQCLDPTGTVYPIELLHAAVKQHLETGCFGRLPSSSNCKRKRDVQTLMKQRLFCVCQKRAMGEMLTCERCYNQFHASCIAAFQLPSASDGRLEHGPCCAHVTDAVF